MRYKSLQFLACASIMLVGGAAPAAAGEWLHFLHHGERPHPTPEPGTPRHFCHNHARAGYPCELARHVEPTNAGDYSGCYVGGGGGHGAGPRCREEGTWGWDYTGNHLSPRNFLGWNHGRYVQSGTGYYRTDEPFPVPNVFSQGLFGALHHERE